jgi:hypothetical protein
LKAVVIQTSKRLGKVLPKILNLKSEILNSRFLTAPVFILLAACAQDSPVAPNGPVNAQLVLAPGQTGAVPATSIQLRFVGVSGDSRCPADALCIQGGDAIVQLDVVAGGGTSARYELHTANSQPAQYGSLTISLLELNPYPFSSRPFSPSEYRATLSVSSG